MTDIAVLVERLNTPFKGRLVLSENGQAIYADREDILKLLKALKEEFKFERLMDITSVDYEDRYEVVYHLMNDEVQLLAVKVKLQKDDIKIPSTTKLWKAADPMESEVYDMMGIVFEGHENLRRILTPEGFEGYPLRKSFKTEPVSRF